MKIVTNPHDMQAISEQIRLERQRIGVVMTMGALHDGHLSLITLAQKDADVVILTIFVNPTQFGPSEDFRRYPRPFERDAELARAAGVDYLFAPEPSGMYPEHYQTSLQCGTLSTCFEGAHRPGHFNGVATVVTKLFNITKPHVAIFGEKDAQQLAIIRRLVLDLNLDLTIVGAPIIREENGLAKSSRNVYLSDDERNTASMLYKSMCVAQQRLHADEHNLTLLASDVEAMIQSVGFNPDYVTFVHNDTFKSAEYAEAGKEYRLLIAARLGNVRLIDNMRMGIEV